jgi:RNA polymerase sigma-70 factor, ECF subfamily
MRTANAIDWDELCDSMRPRLRSVAFSVLRDEHEAEDAIQEALLAAWQGARQLRDAGALEGWLLRVAHNAAVDRLRPLVRQRRMTNLVGAGSDLQICQHRMPAPEERLELNEVLASLSPALRRTVRYGLRGFTDADVAVKEGISGAAVKTRRTRAKAQIREALNLGSC